jgi:hypothetical protein
MQRAETREILCESNRQQPSNITDANQESITLVEFTKRGGIKVFRKERGFAPLSLQR